MGPNATNEATFRDAVDARITELEMRNGQLNRFVDELNEVVVAQNDRLLKLERQVANLADLLGQRSGTS